MNNNEILRIILYYIHGLIVGYFIWMYMASEITVATFIIGIIYCISCLAIGLSLRGVKKPLPRNNFSIVVDDGPRNWNLPKDDFDFTLYGLDKHHMIIEWEDESDENKNDDHDILQLEKSGVEKKHE